MQYTGSVPELMAVRVQTPGGPFAPGDRLYVAFNDPEIGRIARHRGSDCDMRSRESSALSPIPEAIFVEVIEGSEPYQSGDVLALWFVDPRFARIQSQPARRMLIDAPLDLDEVAPRARDVPEAAAAPSRAIENGARSVRNDAHLAVVRLHWTLERVKRFVGVVDRLFTVDRLGWYRHALAMRLLVPDEIRCGDDAVESVATSCLHAVREAAIETLGQPLLEAFMPNFSVTPEWLEALDAPASARSFARLRDTFESAGPAFASSLDLAPDGASTVGTIESADLAATSDLSLDAILPIFIPSVSIFPAVTERLSGYRESLIALFGATARSAKLVRLTQMAEPCHPLDDRLWHLVGAVGECFGGLAPA